MFVGMGEEQDRLLAMIHLTVGQAGLVSDDKLDAILAGNVGCRDDCKFGPVDAAIKSDGADESARDGTTHCGAVPHSLALNVVDITCAAQQLLHAFLAGNRSANDAGCRGPAHGWEAVIAERVDG